MCNWIVKQLGLKKIKNWIKATKEENICRNIKAIEVEKCR